MAADFAERSQTVLQVAQRLFDTDPKPDWVTFFREIMGVEGAIVKEFPGANEARQFEQTDAYSQIQGMVGQLRTDELEQTAGEKTQTITPRVPVSLHVALKAEVKQLKDNGRPGMSLNRLVITKCLAPTRPELLPPKANS